MRMYVGVTDYDWYTQIKENGCDEANFWTPGAANFRALDINDMFLFKLHHPRNFIVGGGFYVRFSILPTYLAWDAFGLKNGTQSLSQLNDRIWRYRARGNGQQENPDIGCIILTEPFFFEENDWVAVPANWSNNIVRGKTYTTDDVFGARLYEQVTDRLQRSYAEVQQENQFARHLTNHRLGQGAFRVGVTEAYQKRCAITGEKTLPVLEAAHIKPYGDDGPHLISNGILLRSDVHTLFDNGYITITPDYHVEVSRRLHEDYGNGKNYYRFHGGTLATLPKQLTELPSKDYLEWHNNTVYYG